MIYLNRSKPSQGFSTDLMVLNPSIEIYELFLKRYKGFYAEKKTYVSRVVSILFYLDEPIGPHSL